MKNSRLTYAERAATSQSSMGRRLLQLLDDKQTNLAISADVTSAEQLVELADLLGPEICIFKTHIDIIHNFSTTLVRDLQQLADKHQFLLFEDRKFADIGHTVKHQYEGGVYHIADWADMVNAHTLPGPGVIDGLAAAGRAKQRGLILIAEMSSAGHLLTPEYMRQTVTMAEQYPDFVFGFITQHALSMDPQWVNLTPGVQLAEGQDALGQRYVTPALAIGQRGADVIIVGRGILSAQDPLATAQTYRKQGWQAYCDRRHSYVE